MLIKKAITALVDYRVRKECRRKKAEISRVADRKYNGPSKETLSEYSGLWKPLIGKPDPFYCTIYKEINGVESNLYVPENAYYTVIEPTLNNRAFALAYADKGFYGVLTGRNDLLPRILLKGIAGVVYNSRSTPLVAKTSLLDTFDVGEEYVLKPATDSAGGRGVVVVKTTGKGHVTVGNVTYDSLSFCKFLRKVYSNNFIIQEKIEQHPWFEAFNRTSVNTVRMMTYREPSYEKVVTLRSVLRFGMPGSIVDNQASGGLSCGISEEGIVQGFAIDKYGRRTQVPAGGEEVPGYELMRSAAKEIARRYPYHRILGFDFCLDASGELKLLEINTRNLEINFVQMNLGPLFREFTSEVIDFCKNSPRTIVLDWDLAP